MDPDTVEGLDSLPYAFPGYTLSQDWLLEPARDGTGNETNPNLILSANTLCSKCQKVMSEVEPRYDLGPTLESPENKAISNFYKTQPFLTGPIKQRVLVSVPFYGSKDEMMTSVESGCYLCARIMVDPPDYQIPSSLHFTTPRGFISITANSHEDFWDPARVYAEQRFDDEIGIRRLA